MATVECLGGLLLFRSGGKVVDGSTGLVHETAEFISDLEPLGLGNVSGKLGKTDLGLGDDGLLAGNVLRSSFLVKGLFIGLSVDRVRGVDLGGLIRSVSTTLRVSTTITDQTKDGESWGFTSGGIGGSRDQSGSGSGNSRKGLTAGGFLREGSSAGDESESKRKLHGVILDNILLSGGDGGAYSEGGAYGSDQSTKVYSPYSVYGEADEKSLYKEGASEYIARKKAVVAETKVRLSKLPAYVAKAKWFEVTDELSRFMYETRASINYLATTPEQKKAAKAFYVAIEEVALNARLKRGDACAAAITDAVAKLDAMSF
eukprot:CAMPEP_0113621196 /NCGR_PEP_ID=MMETSP0017_2-20120614/10824_1 /TAXON_ID=2856 /ORGANISM="Cylindrotheca closterium" /LENGTH=315 /DNA_ID=CAMNT_0000530921 /DNA_START=297 /DNA_END=1243 /DNA_ORIENTATION=- /assembly_acc=CAM_ASM_000147